MTIITLKIKIDPKHSEEFIDWQTQLNAAIAAASGFVSLEISSPNDHANEWIFTERFIDNISVKTWLECTERKMLLNSVIPFLAVNQEKSISEDLSEASKIQGGVTEVFVTQVRPENESAFRQWIGKIHNAEAKFPGFKSAYVQAPSPGQGINWITLIQFDNVDNLDRWLSSEERKKVLKEGEPLIKSIDSHRVISPFAGWFSSIATEGVTPPVWKQAMIVLLVLFPIVMLELKFLSPLLTGFNSSLATFIGNAISVGLVSWPMVPIVIWCMKWWLSPSLKQRQTTFLGTLVMTLLFLIEIAIFWKLL